MNGSPGKTGWKDPVSLVMAGVLLALVAVEALFVPHYSPRFPWHHVPGYAAIIGLGACLVVVQLSKALGSSFLQRPEGAEGERPESKRPGAEGADE